MRYAVINKNTNLIDFFHENEVNSNSYFSIDINEDYDYKFNYLYEDNVVKKIIKPEFDLDSIEKQNLFNKYKSNLEQIKNINSEIDEINQTSEYFPELANKRIAKLESDRTNLRSENWKILSATVDKFWEDIINEF